MKKIWSCILVAMLMAVGCGSSDAACTGSSPTWTSTPDRASVASCVTSASRGDTIQVTAGDGTEDWSSEITLTKGVIFLGPGRDILEITMTGGTRALWIEPDATAITNEELIKVQGFTFNLNNTHELAIFVAGASDVGTKPYRSIAILSNRIKNQAITNLVGNGAFFIQNQVRGVIANNIVDRGAFVLRMFGGGNCGAWTNGNFPFAFGDSDNLFFEDNTMTWSTSNGFGSEGYTETGQNGRIVLRYNTWDMTNTTMNAELWDMHGFQNFSTGVCAGVSNPDGGQTGSMSNEYYGNTISNKVNSFKMTSLRGSQVVVHNNIWSCTTSCGDLALQQYDGGCNALVNSGWPPPNGQINNTYGWNTTGNGSEIAFTVPVGGGANNTCPPVVNTHHWILDTITCTSSACTSGIGRGTTVPTGTCTIGTGYWVASTATPTVSSAVIQNGILYKCTATNTWTSYYTPYTYPHPLQGVAASTSPRFSPRLYLRRAALDEAVLPVRVPDYLHLIDW